jgi:hypothetical protein
MKILQQLLNELEAKIPFWENTNEKVSNASVGWHIEHSLLVIKRVIDSTKKSDPVLYKWKFNIKKIFVFAAGSIPRGKGNAPEPSKPKEDFNESTLQEHIQLIKNKLAEIDSIQPNQYFVHPILCIPSII